MGDKGVMRTAAEVYEPESGRLMTVLTDKPAIQFYIGIGLKGETGKGGAVYNKYVGLCFESQYSLLIPQQATVRELPLQGGGDLPLYNDLGFLD